MMRFAVMLLMIVLFSAAVYGNLAAQTEYHVYVSPPSCWDSGT